MSFDESTAVQKEDQHTQTQMENPQGEVETEEKKALTEPEIVYQLSLLKQKLSINKDIDMMTRLHSRINYTAKVLTK